MALGSLVFMAVAQILIVVFPGKQKLGDYSRISEVHSGWALSCPSQAALLNEMPGGNLPTTEW